MSWIFRKSFKIMPGVRINLGKTGISTTVGPRGTSVNIGKNGTFLNTGIPGTGLFKRTKLSDGNTSAPLNSVEQPVTSNQIAEPQVNPKITIMQYVSASGLIYLLPITYVILMFFYENIYVMGLVFLILVGRGLFYLFAKNKPIYGSQANYTSDRRYKTGARVTGFKKVKIGEETLDTGDLYVYRLKGKARIGLAALVLIQILYVNF